MDDKRRASDEINELIAGIVQTFTRFEDAAVKKQGRHALTAGEMHIIERIGQRPGASMGDTAARLGVTMGTLTVSVNRLVYKGFVTRERAPHDGRVVQLKLTKSGHAAFRLHAAFHKRMVRDIMQNLEEREWSVFIKALQSLEGFLRNNMAD